jgi:hypothetical protein
MFHFYLQEMKDLFEQLNSYILYISILISKQSKTCRHVSIWIFNIVSDWCYFSNFIYNDVSKKLVIVELPKVYIIEIATTIEQNQIKQSKICLNVFTCKIEL